MVESAEPAYQYRVLESLASAQNYIAWLASLERPYLRDEPIEVRAGAGDYAAAWLADGLERITLTEMDHISSASLGTGSTATDGWTCASSTSRAQRRDRIRRSWRSTCSST